jgi:hypothetical protein
MNRHQRRLEKIRKAFEKKAKRKEAKGTVDRVPGGLDCPKCGDPMQRCAHGSSWKPGANQMVYYKYWDRCPPCRHLQHYNDAKVWVVGDEKEGTR